MGQYGSVCFEFIYELQKPQRDVVGVVTILHLCLLLWFVSKTAIAVMEFSLLHNLTMPPFQENALH